VISKNAFRNGAIQLVIHTLDPIAEGKRIYYPKTVSGGTFF